MEVANESVVVVRSWCGLQPFWTEKSWICGWLAPHLATTTSSAFLTWHCCSLPFSSPPACSSLFACLQDLKSIQRYQQKVSAYSTGGSTRQSMAHPAGAAAMGGAGGGLSRSSTAGASDAAQLNVRDGDGPFAVRQEDEHASARVA